MEPKMERLDVIGLTESWPLFKAALYLLFVHLSMKRQRIF